ncbi:unnamed protein product [Agarophyton chilense]|eukprot:gb/GEZJ01000210.1/.p1 GENE.gb/GEZJ01000210.1/~~gb/GEZJ01000210.1/.p1  ORF type:complete len:421 (+),score=56.72 gb/GEZJ01000210.1/:3950-5212(+)
MGFFRRGKQRQVTSEPLPEWDDTRWRSHLRASALGVDYHCNLYVEVINNERKEAARFFKENDEARARSHAETSFRNKRIISALGALAPITNALHQRAEPLAGYTSIAAIPHPARSNIISIIYAASRLQMSYLTDMVEFLREQFGSYHIEQIQQGLGDLFTHVNPTVRDSLSTMTPSRDDTNTELASAVKEYYGISVNPTPVHSVTQAATSVSNRVHAPPFSAPVHSAVPPPPPIRATKETLRKSHTTPLSAESSDIGPMSPELHSSQSGPQHENNLKTPSPPRPDRNRMFASRVQPSQSKREHAPQSHQPAENPTAPIADDVGLPTGRSLFTDDVVLSENSEQPDTPVQQQSKLAENDNIPVPETEIQHVSSPKPRPLRQDEEKQDRELPEHLKNFQDSDEMLFKRYEQLKEVWALTAVH